jgi:hypothetical protein
MNFNRRYIEGQSFLKSLAYIPAFIAAVIDMYNYGTYHKMMISHLAHNTKSTMPLFRTLWDQAQIIQRSFTGQAKFPRVLTDLKEIVYNKITQDPEMRNLIDTINIDSGTNNIILNYSIILSLRRLNLLIEKSISIY